MKSNLPMRAAKALACITVLGGLAVPAASAFTVIELLDYQVPTTTVRSSGAAPAAKGASQPVGTPAVQKAREEPRPCAPGQVAAPKGQGCQAAGPGTAPAAR